MRVAWVPRRLLLLLAGSALLLAPLLAVQLSAGAGRAEACSCPPPRPPLEALDRASAVFTGRVVSFGTWSFEANDLPFWSVEFEVSQVWKGTATRTTFAYITHGPTCGYPWFEIGKVFLVYAGEWHQGTHPWQQVMAVSQCGGTKRIEHAEEDLLALGAGQASKPGVTGTPPAHTEEGQDLARDLRRSLAWWAPLLAGLAAAALIIRRWARRREVE